MRKKLSVTKFFRKVHSFLLMQKLLNETPFKILSIESKNGMILVVRMKIVFDENNKPKEKVFEILTRKLENLNDILNS